jgi:WD40 repeat protein
MQAGLRAWLLRNAQAGGHGLREPSPTILLALVCSAALSPLLAAGAGLTGTAAVAGIGVLSSVGSGALTEVVIRAIDRLRTPAGHGAPAGTGVEEAIAHCLEQALSREDGNARVLRAELAAVLEQIDAGGTALRTAIETGSDEIRRDMVAVVHTLATGSAELNFLITDVVRAAAEIQRSLDDQAASVRVIIGQNAQQSAEIRLAREDLAAIGTNAGTLSSATGPERETRWIHGCPYRGLLPFGESDADVFYGRERKTTELAVQVAHQAAGSGIVVVTGASGAGKSSLVRAGLLPALARGTQVTGSENWPRVVLTPMADPLSELAAHIAALNGSDASSVRAGLAAHPELAHLAVRQAVVADDRRRIQAGRAPAVSHSRLVLVVDQFEQLFTLNPGRDGEAGRRAFIIALHTAATHRTGADGIPPAVVILVVRGDFCDRCAAYPELADALGNKQFVVGPMSESDLRRAISGPAEAAGLRIDAALPDTIIADLLVSGGEDPVGALPLLSQAMLLTWEDREGNRLTSHGYGQAGGVRQAVQASANAVYNSLSPQQQALAREIFRSMTVTGRDGRLGGRPVARDELYSSRQDSDRAHIDAVLEAFASKRLIVLDSDTTQIAHDVLLTAWPELRGWLDDDQASWILHGQLEEDALAWGERGSDPSYLYRGSQLFALAQARDQWSASPLRYPAMTRNQEDFLHASERAEGRAARWRRIVATFLIVLLTGSLAGAGVAVSAARNANRQRATAVSDQLAAESIALDHLDPVTASLLAAAAWRVTPGPQARESLLQAFAQPERAVFADPNPTGREETVFSPSEKILITAGGVLQFWDSATHRRIGSPVRLPRGTLAVASSPDGKTVATVDFDNLARLWNAVTHQQVGPPIGGVTDVTFSPEGKTLATAGEDGTARIWNVTTHRQVGPPMTAGSASLNALAFSPDGRTLATVGADGMARLWDVATGQQIGAPMTASTGRGPTLRPAAAVAFSPSGTMLATAGDDGTARLWNVATHRQIGQPIIGSGVRDLDQRSLTAVAFSPSGTILATSAADGTARLWDVMTHEQIGAPLVASIGVGASDVAFSPDGLTLATGGFDSTARLWDVDFGYQAGASISAAQDLNAVAFTPSGKTLATAGFDGTARRWDLATRRQTGPVVTGSPQADSALLNSTGTVEAVSGSAASASGSLVTAMKSFDIASGRQIGPQVVPPSGASSSAISPDGHILATGGDQNGQVQLWATSTGREIQPPLDAGLGFDVDALAFSGDGRLLATASGRGSVRVWDTRTHHEIGQTIAAGGFVEALAFSPDDKMLATSDNGAVRLWNLFTAQPVGLPMTSAQDVDALAFSANGTILATAGRDGTARLWDASTDHQIGAAVAATTHGPVNGVAFSPSSSLLATAGDDGTARLWNTAFPRNLLRAICTIAGRSLTMREWNTYASSEPYRRICP